jgi:hypothetical protein
MALASTHVRNDADIALENFRRSHPYYVQQDQEESIFSRISGAFSDTVSSVSDYISSSSIANAIKPVAKFVTFAVTSAAVASVAKTVIDSGFDALLNITTSPIKETFLEGLTIANFLTNSLSGLFGSIIFGIGLPMLKNAIQDEPIQPPPAPRDFTSAVKAGCLIGKVSTISTATWSLGTKLINKFAPPYIASWLSTILPYYFYIKVGSYLLT